MYSAQRGCIIAWLATGCLVVSGCAPGTKLDTVKVKGKVTYNSEPLAGATVSFLSQEKDGKTAGGVTNEQGEYTLTTMATMAKAVEGAVPGEYKVVIVKKKKSAAQLTQEKYASLSPEEMQKLPPEERAKMGMNAMSGGAQSAEAELAAGSLIPEKYSVPEQSGLTATVKSGQTEPINFDLTD